MRYLGRGGDVTVGLLRIDTGLKLVGYINLGITRLSRSVFERVIKEGIRGLELELHPSFRSDKYIRPLLFLKRTIRKFSQLSILYTENAYKDLRA